MVIALVMEGRIKKSVITLKFETYFVVVYCHTNSSNKGCAVFCVNGCSILSYKFE